MIVKQILEAKGGDVATAAPSATIAHVVAMLAKRRIGAVVITGPMTGSSGSHQSAMWCGRLTARGRRSSNHRCRPS